MSVVRKSSIDWSSFRDGLHRQFSNLDPNDPSRWPWLPRILLLVVVGVALLGVLWYLWIADQSMQLEQARQRELELRAQLTQKASRAAAIDVLKEQLEQVRQFVTQLEKQLPGRAEMDALLSDINQAGVGRGLQFELFRPGQEQVRDHYVELPITIRVAGSFDEIGQFVSDVAHLSRIVTLANIAIAPSPAKSDQLVMEATAKTFRYLEPEERQAHQSNASKDKGGA